MKKTLALLMCAALPALAAAAQPDVEALKLNPQNKLYCNEQADWCVGIKLDGGFEDNGPFASSRSLRADYRIWDLPDIPNFSNFTVWPHLIRLSEERALVGVIGPAAPDYKQEIQFSGGSFSRKDLYLFMVDLDQKVSGLVHVMPLSAKASIRSCFNESDQQRREANCMDQYRYDAVLKAVAGGQSYPDLQVTTRPRVHRRGQPLCGFEQAAGADGGAVAAAGRQTVQLHRHLQMERGRFGVSARHARAGLRRIPGSPAAEEGLGRFDVLDGPARARGIVPAQCAVPQIRPHEIHLAAMASLQILVIPTLITAVCA